MTALRRRTPRLFTGAIFPEEISRGLTAFAERYNLESDVWVPKRLVKDMKEGCTLLPNAILCDILLVSACGSTDLRALGHDRILVNAAHTTDVEFFEGYKSNISAKPHGTLPLSSTGAPFAESRSKALELVARKADFKSPYWVREGGSSKRLVNAEETLSLGRYNPTDCVAYEPRSLTNQVFPCPVATVMRRKASRLGYASRTWMTATEGAAFGMKIDERKNDSPPIFTSHLSGRGCVHAEEYYCADQFQNTDTFPTGRDIDLAVSGVLIDQRKVCGFPLLFSIAGESSAAVRHDRITEEFTKLAVPTLFNPLRMSFIQCDDYDLRRTLQRFAFLRGYTNPYFIFHMREVAETILLKPREQGIVLSIPAPHGTQCTALCSGCFFNMEQFEEPLLVREMVTRTPTLFPSQAPVLGPLCAWECVRVQCVNAAFSQMWIPALFLEYLDGRWALSPNAFHMKCKYRADEHAFGLYNLSDVEVPNEAVEWWPSYKPHDIFNKPYKGALKAQLSLRAWERRYTSTLWVSQEQLARHGVGLKPRGEPKSYLRGRPFERDQGVIFNGCLLVNIEEVRNTDCLFARLRSDSTTACEFDV